MKDISTLFLLIALIVNVTSAFSPIGDMRVTTKTSSVALRLHPDQAEVLETNAQTHYWNNNISTDKKEEAFPVVLQQSQHHEGTELFAWCRRIFLNRKKDSSTNEFVSR